MSGILEYTPRTYAITEKHMAMTCGYCDQEMNGTACTTTTTVINGKPYQRTDQAHQVPEGRPCHDCGAPAGGLHHPGCDMEACPICGGQLLSCDHGPHGS